MKRARSDNIDDRPSKVPNLGISLPPPPQPMNLPQELKPMNLPQELLDNIALQAGTYAPAFTKIFRSTPSVAKKAEKAAIESFKKDDPRSAYARAQLSQMEDDYGYGYDSGAQNRFEDVFEKAPPGWPMEVYESYINSL